MIPVLVDSDALSTYRVEYPNEQAAFVVAENKTIADRLYRAEIVEDPQLGAPVGSVEDYADYPITDAESLLHEGVNFLISQDPEQPRMVERRVNMAGKESLYTKRHPYRFRERLSDSSSAELD